MVVKGREITEQTENNGTNENFLDFRLFRYFPFVP